MGLERMLARDAFDVVAINTGTSGSPTWTAIAGITNVSPDSTADTTDDTDFESGGISATKVVSRSKALTVSGNYLEDPDTGDQDPGQAALYDSGDLIGYDSNTMFKVTSLGGNEYTFEGSVEFTQGGGGTNDNGAFEAKITISGAVTFTPPA
jgi:hypothetical protein